MVVKKINTTHENGLWIFMLCSFLVGLDALVVGPLIPSIANSLSFQPNLGGLLVTSYALLYGLSAPLFGPISDRWGRKKMIVLGLIVFTVGTALTSFSSDLLSAVIYRGIAGLGGAMLMPSVYAMIGDTFPYEKRGKAIGAVMGAMIGSQILGVPAGAFLAKNYSWQSSFLIIAFLSFVTVLIVLKGVQKGEPRKEQNIGPVKAYFGQYKSVFSHPPIFFALLSTFLWMAALQGMFAYVGVFYEENFHLSVDKIGLIAMFAAAMSVLGSTYGGRLADKYGKRTIIGITAVMSATGVLLFSLMTKLFVGAFVTQLFWALAVGAGQATITALISELSPNLKGTVLSLNSSAMYLGMMGATATSAMILESGGGFFSIGIMCSFMAILVMPITKLLFSEKSNASVQKLSR